MFTSKEVKKYLSLVCQWSYNMSLNIIWHFTEETFFSNLHSACKFWIGKTAESFKLWLKSHGWFFLCGLESQSQQKRASQPFFGEYSKENCVSAYIWMPVLSVVYDIGLKIDILRHFMLLTTLPSTISIVFCTKQANSKLTELWAIKNILNID